MQIKMDVKFNASVWDVHQPQGDKNRLNTSIIFLFEAAGPLGVGGCKHSQRTEGQKDMKTAKAAFWASGLGPQ